MTNDQTTTENMNDAIHRLSLALGAAQTDLMTTTTSLLTDAPYATERLAEAIGAIEGLKMRLRETLRLIEAYQRDTES